MILKAKSNSGSPSKVTEGKRLEVIQLLREYRAFHTAFGGAMSAEDTHLISAEYGSGGRVALGAYYFEHASVSRLIDSYEALEEALQHLEKADRGAYLFLVAPYLGDPGDPSIVDIWRKRQKQIVRGRIFTLRHDRAIVNHDLAVEIMAEFLAGEDLYVDWPKRTTSTEATNVENRNDELYEVYGRMRTRDGFSKSKAVRKAAEHCQYTERHAWRIVNVREAPRET